MLRRPAGTHTRSAGTPYRLVPAHFYHCPNCNLFLCFNLLSGWHLQQPFHILHVWSLILLDYQINKLVSYCILCILYSIYCSPQFILARKRCHDTMQQVLMTFSRFTLMICIVLPFSLSLTGISRGELWGHADHVNIHILYMVPEKRPCRL